MQMFCRMYENTKIDKMRYEDISNKLYQATPNHPPPPILNRYKWFPTLTSCTLAKRYYHETQWHLFHLRYLVQGYYRQLPPREAPIFRCMMLGYLVGDMASQDPQTRSNMSRHPPAQIYWKVKQLDAQELGMDEHDIDEHFQFFMEVRTTTQTSYGISKEQVYYIIKTHNWVPAQNQCILGQQMLVN